MIAALLVEDSAITRDVLIPTLSDFDEVEVMAFQESEREAVDWLSRDSAVHPRGVSRGHLRDQLERFGLNEPHQTRAASRSACDSYISMHVPEHPTITTFSEIVAKLEDRVPVHQRVLATRQPGYKLRPW